MTVRECSTSHILYLSLFPSVFLDLLCCTRVVSLYFSLQLCGVCYNCKGCNHPPSFITRAEFGSSHTLLWLFKTCQRGKRINHLPNVIPVDKHIQTCPLEYTEAYNNCQLVAENFFIARQWLLFRFTDSSSFSISACMLLYLLALQSILESKMRKDSFKITGCDPCQTSMIADC